MIPYDTPLTITLDGQPVVILGTDTGSYVAADGRTWPILADTEPATDAAGIQAHIDAFLALPPVVPVPEEVTRVRFLVAAYTVAGVTTDQIQAAIDAIADADAKYLTGVWFANALTVRRDNTYVIQLLAALEKTAEQLDAVFAAAGQLPD